LDVAGCCRYCEQATPHSEASEGIVDFRLREQTLGLG